MPSDYYFGYYFYAPKGRFQACGMFTLGHIVAAAACFILVIGLLFAVRKNITEPAKSKLIRIIAIILTVLESVKILHSFIYGDLNLDAWFPLSYCGLFIFAAWMAGFGKSYIRRAGEVFIAYGCPVAGIAFLIFPTTSLMSFPIWHFFSLYSLFFHSVMIFMGVIFLKEEKPLNYSAFKSYSGFVIIFAIPAILLNVFFGSNLMNLREPYNIPIEFLQSLYSSFPPGYTGLVLAAYMLIPIIVALISGKLRVNTQNTNP